MTRSGRWVPAALLLLLLFTGYALAGQGLPQDACVDVGARFTIDASGILTDRGSGLQWYMEKDNDIQCLAAEALADSLTVADGGWRMPSVAELMGLYRSCGKEKGVPRLFGMTGSWVWAAADGGGKKATMGPAMRQAVAFDSGAVIELQPSDTFNLRALAVRGQSRPTAATYSHPSADVTRGLVGPLVYVSTQAPAIRVTLGKRFTPIGEETDRSSFLFNRKGQSAYIMIRHSADMAPDSPLRPGKGVEGWMSQLTREWIVDADVKTIAGENWMVVDRLAADSDGSRCLFIRDLRCYTANQQFLNIVFFERLDRVGEQPWTSCRPLSERQQQKLVKVIKGFADNITIETYVE